MSAAAGTSMLNYNSKRQPALSATMERVKIPPQNGTIFEMGSTIDIRLPNMPHGNFLDFHNSYLKLNIQTVKTINVAAVVAQPDAEVPVVGVAGEENVLYLPPNGVYGGLIQRIEIISAAQTISVIDEYAKLCNIFLTSESDAKFKGGVGSVQYGMDDVSTTTQYGSRITGDNADAGTLNNFYCFPLILTNLMSSSKYLPLFSSDNIIIRLTLNSKDRAFVTQTNVLNTTTVKIANVEMVNQIVKLDPMAAKLVDDSVGGRYEIVCDDWRNAKSQIADSSTTMNVNLGFSFASLSRVIFAFYKTSVSAHDSDSENSRSHRNITEYSLQINGVNHPAQRIKAETQTASNLSEIMAEIRGSTRQSLDFTQASTITKANFSVLEPTGKGNGIGSAFYEIDTEGLRNYDNEDGVYSGVYTVGSVTSLDATMSDGVDTAQELNVWGQFQATLSLDTRGDNIFTYRS